DLAHADRALLLEVRAALARERAERGDVIDREIDSAIDRAVALPVDAIASPEQAPVLEVEAATALGAAGALPPGGAGAAADGAGALGGTLERHRFADVLRTLHQRGATGVLLAVSDEMTAWLYLAEGVVVAASSTS